MMQCTACNTVSTDADFDQGCPDCGSMQTIPYEGELCQCIDCGSIGAKDDFVEMRPWPHPENIKKLVGVYVCPDCGGSNCREFEE